MYKTKGSVDELTAEITEEKLESDQVKGNLPQCSASIYYKLT